MAMTINTNVISLNAQRNLSMSGSSLGTTMQRLSSGLRVNSAKDDSAGLAIAERMSAQAKGFAVASRNANDGISLAQTAEGALSKVGDMLQRARELAVQSSNATNSDNDRKALQAEVDQLMSEVDRVAKTTAFNGKKLLDGSFSAAVFQIGAGAGDNITVGALQNTKLDALSDVKFGTSESTEVKLSDLTAFDTAIASADGKTGTLKIRVGTNEAVNLGVIDKASSAEERMGQVVAAINAKTADTGVTAFLEDGDTAGTKVLQLRSSSEDAVSLEGFNTAQTGFGVAVTVGLTSAQKGTYDSATAGAAKVDTWATATRATLTSELLKTANIAVPVFSDTGPFAGTSSINSLLTSDSDYAAAKAAFQSVVMGNLENTHATPLTNYTWVVKADSVSKVQEAAVTFANAIDAAVVKLGQTARNTVYTSLDAALKDPKTSTINTLNTNLVALGATAGYVTGGNATAPTDPDELKALQNSILSRVDEFMSGKTGISTTDGAEVKIQKGLDTLDISTQAGSWNAIQKLDSAMDQVNAARGDLGALQTRFEKTVENIDIMNENISAARGRIVDADFATETANLSRSQILQQAGTAMVAQANQLPQNVLSLLR